MLCPLEVLMFYFQTGALLSRKTGLRSHFQEHTYGAVFVLETYIALKQMLYLSPIIYKSFHQHGFDLTGCRRLKGGSK